MMSEEGSDPDTTVGSQEPAIRDGGGASGDDPDGVESGRTRDPDAELKAFLKEATVSVAIVAVIGAMLFAVTGVWPPMVAIQSGSMEPHLERGDLVVVSEPGRYVPPVAHDETGVVTHRAAMETDYRTFGDHGSVVVYAPPGRSGAPVIHRARFWVDDGEDWFGEANASYHRASSCDELPNCPAPHAGFITKGDNNPGYDQTMGISEPVKPAWVVGVGHLRIPLLGYVRLGLVTDSRVRPQAAQSPATATVQLSNRA